MLPVSTIQNNILLHGTNYRNILVVDAATTYHIAVYLSDTNTFKDINTQKIIVDPVMWDYLPKFDEVTFQNEVDKI